MKLPPPHIVRPNPDLCIFCNLFAIKFLKFGTLYFGRNPNFIVGLLTSRSLPPIFRFNPGLCQYFATICNHGFRICNLIIRLNSLDDNPLKLITPITFLLVILYLQVKFAPLYFTLKNDLP